MQLAADSQLWTRVDLHELQRRHGVTLKHRRFRLRWLARQCPRLKHLALNDSKEYLGDDVLYFVRLCPDISELALPFSRDIDAPLVHHALKSLTLSKLNLEGCGGITSDLFDEHLGERFHELVDLNISHCNLVGGQVRRCLKDAL